MRKPIFAKWQLFVCWNCAERLSEKKISKVFCFLSWGPEATIKDMIVLYMKNKLKNLLVVVGKEDFTSLWFGAKTSRASPSCWKIWRGWMSGDQIFQISAGWACVGKYEDAFAWEVCHWPLRVGAACLHLLQYNSIIASLWQYNCYHCELGENLKLYSCLESMRAPDNMYYSLRGCSTISYCSLSVIFYKIGVQILWVFMKSCSSDNL